MKRLLIASFFLLSFTQTLLAESGRPVTQNDFTGLLLVTPDADWQQKWNTSEATVPKFNQASTVRYGEQLSILTFFANPKADKSGNVDVVCNLKVVRPDGSLSVDAKDVQCAKGKLQGHPRNVRLSPAVLKFVGEESDPPGVWKVEVKLTDKVRGTSLTLKSQFELKK